MDQSGGELSKLDERQGDESDHALTFEQLRCELAPMRMGRETQSDLYGGVAGKPEQPEETTMRQLRIIAFGAASAIACAGALMSKVEALPLNASQGVRAASESVNPTEQAACWRYGWHGWGWYPFCGPPPGPPVWAWEPGCRDVTVRERRGFETVVRHIHRCD
jgi:hypothetical protein